MNFHLSNWSFLARRIRAVLLLGSVMVTSLPAPAEPVGIAGQRMDVFLPGPELSVRPLRTGKDPLDLRILAVYPHGTTGFRYDLEFIGYVPGRLDLSPWLVPKAGATAVALPPVEVEVTFTLPPGRPGPLEDPGYRAARVGSGYTIVLFLLTAAWLAGGGWLLYAWLKSLKRDIPEPTASEPSPADLLRPWVQRALKGELDASGKAELERRILGFWRDRLGLADQPAAEALAKVREDEEAGRLPRLIEKWLHDPTAQVTEAEVNHALEPYARMNTP